ncbi:hypothetical protein M404DRAFT_1003523 [Pisolithus tinctorius Marx 270]|uniref:Uncharacterized protein n=1 Tax=Pisolithus tinctorius Marx 270 TaxID=870435 RepID=A0A0C3JTJ2_PISTI|nr:hypothetical protein M404DRAFT_1003523 [Pisolithus tinctorius Marx 270]
MGDSTKTDVNLQDAGRKASPITNVFPLQLAAATETTAECFMCCPISHQRTSFSVTYKWHPLTRFRHITALTD